MPQEPQPGKEVCATMRMHESLLQQPEYAQAVQAARAATLAQLQGAAVAGAGPLRVRVTFHVVKPYVTAGSLDATISQQLTELNACLAGQVSAVAGAPFSHLQHDTRIRFQQSGSVKYVHSEYDIFDPADDSTKNGRSVKTTARGGSNPVANALNVWICEYRASGYGTYPTSPLAPEDGVVMDFDAFGSQGLSIKFTKGRTLVHEVGHWLGLREIWDPTVPRFPDIPSQTGPHYGRPPNPCHPPVQHMYMNFMDYADDEVRWVFTPRQSAFMRATLKGVRSACVLP